MQNDDIKALIAAGIAGANVTVNGADGTHFDAVIISDKFKGMTMVQQHQLVYRTLGQKMGTDIHALSIQTYTPEDWVYKKGLQVI